MSPRAAIVLALMSTRCGSSRAPDSAASSESSASSDEGTAGGESTAAASESSGTGAGDPMRLDPGESCGLLDAERVTLGDRVLLHDFDDPVPGCAASFGPSGIDYHPGLDRIIVVSDKGQYALLSPDGGEVECHDLPGDNEGVTVVDPDDPRVVFVDESSAGNGKALLRVVDLSTHAAVASFIVDFDGGANVDEGHGVEGLAYTAGRPGLDAGFVVGDQTLAEGRSGCSVPWTDVPGDDAVRPCTQQWAVPGLREISGIDDDPNRGLLWVSSDKDDLLVALDDPQGPPRLTIPFPADTGPGQEGHAVVGCTLLLSLDANDDARQVLRYTLHPG